jgi:hypothetical protein
MHVFLILFSFLAALTETTPVKSEPHHHSPKNSAHSSTHSIDSSTQSADSSTHSASTHFPKNNLDSDYNYPVSPNGSYVRNVKDIYDCKEDLCLPITEFVPYTDNLQCTDVYLKIYFHGYVQGTHLKKPKSGYLPPGKGVTLKRTQLTSDKCRKIKR